MILRERYRLIQGGIPVAWADGSTALDEIIRYAIVYGQDGPVLVERHYKGKWKALRTQSLYTPDRSGEAKGEAPPNVG